MENGIAAWVDDVQDVRIIGEGIAMSLLSGDRVINLRISHHVSRKINEAVRRHLDAADNARKVVALGRH